MFSYSTTTIYYYTNSVPNFGNSDPSTPVWLDNLSCYGYESNIAECVPRGSRWGYVGSNCASHNYDIAVRCGPLENSEINVGDRGWYCFYHYSLVGF